MAKSKCVDTRVIAASHAEMAYSVGGPRRPVGHPNMGPDVPNATRSLDSLYDWEKVEKANKR